MGKLDYIPRRDSLFNQWQDNLLSYIDPRRSEWNIPDGLWAELTQLQSVWRTTYARAENPETRTSAAVLGKTEARDAYQAAIRMILKAYITYNPFVSVADRANMQLPVHDTKPTPAPVPTTYPDFDLNSSIIRLLTVRFRDHGANTNAKPAGVHGAEIRYGFSDTPHPSPDTLLHSSFATSSPHSIEFSEAERGRRVYICLRWENTRGEKGPWSEVVMGIVP
jgi:hypothetical protein